MKKSIKTILGATMAMAVSFTAKAQVVINEIMQSNVDCIMDDLNDFPDSWVEIYNAGDEAVNLSAYSLGITKKADEAWQLPSYTLQPKAYRLIYCDKANEDWETYKAPNKRESLNWHTPYRLESGKDCTLYLFKDGEVVDNLPTGMKKQPAPNIAYGRETDGGENWGYQAVPTPKAANCGTVYSNKDVLGNPVFSTPGKVFQSGQISLTISLPEDAPEGTVIRYTDDGSEPTASSKKFTSAITISSTKVIRARLFCDGKLSPRSVTQSYIKIDRDVTLPVFSIVTDKKYLNDPQIGIYTAGSYTYTSSGGWGDDPNEEKKNYFYNWRRPMNFEYFEGADVESSINQLGEARITGAYTRRENLKSLCLYANKRFGEKRLKHEFFPDQRPGLTDFKSIILRNAGNDHNGLYMRDAIIQCSMAKYLDLDWQAWRPAIVFINGEYKGMLNIRERSNEDNIYTNYNGLEDIDMVENWDELKQGTKDSWNAFQSFYNESGHTYDEYNNLMDVQEFMDIMIFNAFFYNTDFPGNNIVFWRPTADGGRWRNIVKDTDFGLGLYDGNKYKYNYVEWLYKANEAGNSSEATRLFRSLMEDEDFKREFIDRSAIYMGDFMNYDRIWEVWEPMHEMTRYEYSYFRQNTNPWWDPYTNNFNDAKNFLKKRPENHYDHLRSYFKLGALKPLVIDKSKDDISVTFNGWKLSHGTFDGKFFAGRTIILEGENMTGWEITETSGKGTNKIIVEGNSLEYAIPSSCTSVTVTAYYGEPEGGDDPVVTPSDMNILANGTADNDFDRSIKYNDMQQNYTVCAWGKEHQSSPHPADIETIDGDRVFVVHAADCVNPGDAASAWDNQFWIQAPQEFHTGDEFKISFRYKASKNARATTQVHTQSPGSYLHWEGLGYIDFTTEWQTFEKTVTVNASQNGMWSFAFNLTEEVKTATDFYFDDLTLIPAINEDNMLAINNQEIQKGSTVMVPVYMKNENSITSFSCSIHLPSGLSVATDDYGNQLFELSDRCSLTHVLASANDKGVIRLSGSSPNNSAISGSEGVLFYIPVIADDNINEGTVLPVSITNVTMVDAETQYVLNCKNATCKLTIVQPTGIEFATTQSNAPRYTLNGYRATNGRGIIIQRGKKIMVK